MDTFIDLYWDVAESLALHEYFTEALYFYTAINDQEQYNGPTTWAAMGRCYTAINELQQAEECYVMVAKENPTDFDSRLRLAEIYEQTGRKGEALEVISAGIYLFSLHPFSVFALVSHFPATLSVQISELIVQ